MRHQNHRRGLGVPRVDVATSQKWKDEIILHSDGNRLHLRLADITEVPYNRAVRICLHGFNPKNSIKPCTRPRVRPAHDVWGAVTNDLLQERECLARRGE